MSGVRLALLAASIWTATAGAAFETLRTISPSIAFDPIRPVLHYWHASPGRLLDSDSHVHLAAALPHGLDALRTASADVTLHPGPAGLGFSCSVLGHSEYYQELLVTSGIALEMLQRLALAVTAEYGRVQPGSRFSPLADWSAGAGVRVRFNGQVSLDLSAAGFGGPPSDRRGLFSPRLAGGVTLDYSSQLSLRAGAKSWSEWSLGETVRLGPGLALAADLLTGPLRLCLGVLLSVGRFGFDFLYRDHPELGGDLSVGLVIRT